MILTNDKGEILLAGCELTKDDRGITYLELLAILKGLTAVRGKFSGPLHLESDLLEAVLLLHRQMQNITEIRWIIDDIRNMEDEVRLITTNTLRRQLMVLLAN